MKRASGDGACGEVSSGSDGEQEEREAVIDMTRGKEELSNHQEKLGPLHTKHWISKDPVKNTRVN